MFTFARSDSEAVWRPYVVFSSPTICELDAHSEIEFFCKKGILKTAFQIPEILEKYFWNDFWNASYLRGIRFAFQIPEILVFESWDWGPSPDPEPSPKTRTPEFLESGTQIEFLDVKRRSRNRSRNIFPEFLESGTQS